MIVSLVRETCELIREIDEREKAKNDAESVEETLGALTALSEKVIQLQTSIQLLAGRLPSSDIKSAIFIGERCASQVSRSAEQFVIQPRQKIELQATQSQIQKALDSLQTAWQSYAAECMREPFDLYRLVCSLPEVAAHKAAYDDLQRQLLTAKNTLPSSARQLQDFDRAIEQFKQLLREIEGLSEAVKAFLLKTLGGTAFLADVTDEVLQWCRQGQRAQTFSIQFAR